MKSIDRRNFLKGVTSFGLGSAFFTLALPKGSWAAAAAEDCFQTSMEALGTTINLSIFGEKPLKAQEAAKDAFDEIRRIDDLMSTHRMFSMISRLNNAAGSEMVDVDARVADLLRASVEWGKQSNGVFDVTILPLLRAWGFRPDDRNFPENMDDALKCVGYKNIVVEGDKAGLHCKGAAVDFGGIGKGYAADRAASLLHDKWGITKAIVACCGDIYAIGKPDDAPGWKIGIHNPLTDQGSCATFDLADGGVSTSGGRTERVERGGKSYCDMFDPYTGQPVEPFLSTTTFAKTAMDADAAATTLFVAGKGDRKEIVKPGVAWVNITQEGKSGLAFAQSAGCPVLERI